MGFVVAAIVVAVAAGVGAERRWSARSQREARRALDVMLFVLLPFITFFVVARTAFTTGVVAGLGLAYVELAIVGVLAWLTATRLLRLPDRSAGVVIIAVVLANTGYLGVPLNAALFGREALGPALTYDALVSGPMFYVTAFAIGAAFSTRGEPVGARARAFFTRNPPLIAVLAALVAPDALAPEALVDVAEVLVIALLPVGFFVLGVNLAAEAEEGALRFPPRMTRPIAATVALRLVAAPLLLMALAAPLVALPDAYLVQAAMPSGINTLVVAHAYALDVRLASGAIAWSTTLAVLGAVVGLAL